ncbi:hypothetical protein [Streptomyces sp. NPDC057287]|uniref:hypothetical protein n=1 Tax=Streptomyces sp. NPDC057287 TaxID=3346086 RepID=UPI00362E62FC
MKKKNVVLWGAGITAAATIAGAVIMIQGSRGGDNGNAGGDGDGCRVVNAKGDVTCAGTGTDEPDSFKGGDRAKSQGPWRYKVVNTFVDDRDEGLMARICNADDCAGPDSDAAVGMALQNRSVWVVCHEDSGFNGGEPDGGTVWFKVLWPTDKPNLDVQVSGRENRYTAWMFGKYLSPSGHDGNISQCSDL